MEVYISVLPLSNLVGGFNPSETYHYNRYDIFIQNENLPQIGVKIKHVCNHHPRNATLLHYPESPRHLIDGVAHLRFAKLGVELKLSMPSTPGKRSEKHASTKGNKQTKVFI